MLEFQGGTITFPSKTGSAQVLSSTEKFSKKVRIFDAYLKGYEIKFTTSEHPLHHIKVELTAKRVSLHPDTDIEVTCTFGLRDRTGTFDDAFSGDVTYGIVADVEP